MRILNAFHREVPVQALCLYRALLGTVLFCETLSWLPHTTELFSSMGFHIPNLPGTPEPFPALALFLGIALVLGALAVALGFFARVAAALLLFLLTYVYCLDSLNEKTAQTISILALAILVFTPCGARFSLDHWLRKRAGKGELPEMTSIFAQRLLQIEFAQIYFFSGIAKMTNPEWVNGSVFYRVLNGRLATPVGIYLSSLDPDLLARAGGLGTILFELFQGLFLFLPFVRPFAIGAGLLFHTGIQSTLLIGSLGAHFVIALLLLFPEPETVKRIVAKALPSS